MVVPFLTSLFDISQKGAPESDSASGAALHCAAVHESHFSRTANGLHSSPHVHPLSHTSVSTDRIFIEHAD